jgi:hypothetical protein
MQTSHSPIAPQTQHVLLAAYQAFNTRDIETVLSLMTPDVDWPNGWEGGYEKGHSQVRAYWQRQWATINPSVHPLHIYKQPDGRITVEVHQLVKDLSGEILFDGMVHHVYQLDGNLIRRMEIQHP